MKEKDTTTIEMLGTLGGFICLLAGIVLLCLGSVPWGIVVGALLVDLAWGLAMESGEMAGRRRGRLEERLKQERERD